MTEQPLRAALGSLINYNQFYTVRLEWNPQDNKYKKTPCYLNGSIYPMDAQNPANWTSFDTATDAAAKLNATADGYRYTIGFYLTAALKLWFLDLDNCVLPDRTFNAIAVETIQSLPGCFFEFSCGGNGGHILGRGELPENHRCKNSELDIELYHKDRSITFGLTGTAYGSADTVAQPPLQYFPTIERGVAGTYDNGPRSDWCGPVDDDDLIRRACSAQSAASVFGDKACFADLWTNNTSVLNECYPGESEADLALAIHLAFWTGCDAERIERLMRRSALYRPKWDEHRTYLRELTITTACQMQSTVCIDKPVEPKLSVVVTPEQMQSARNYIEEIVSASEDDLRNKIIPSIAIDRSIQPLDRQRLAALLKDRFAVFQIPTTIAMCRNMLRMQQVKTDDEESAAIPDFSKDHVYVLANDSFINLKTGVTLSKTGFNAQFNRLMPVRSNGDREDAARWCLERWGMSTVDHSMYAPGKELIFDYAGRRFVNIFSPLSFPVTATQYSAQGCAAIEKFLKVLWLACSERKEVFDTLIDWLAHNVQFPGKKIRFSPLIKGVEGDGKSIIATVLRTCMGPRNVRSLGPSIIANNGGFTGWAEGYAVQACEELYVSGSDRYRVYNIVKEFISNSFCSVQPKGQEPKDIINFTNYLGFTNYVNAIPLSNNDRRWWIIFTPFTNCMQLATKLVLSGVEELNRYFGEIFKSLDENGSEWRKFFIDHPITATFNPDGHAPFTVEKNVMMVNGEDEYEAIARQVISGGYEGVTSTVLSSSCLAMAMRTVAMLDGFEPPKTTTFHHLLLRLGFSQRGVVKWKNKTHRIWSSVARELSNDEMRQILDASVSL